jgi:EAL domain-containing protein (putative c-di-GMP-specific phosphodiesterase class I)
MNADAAMYRAKELGRNNFQFHSSELHARSLERLALQDGLRHAVERNELSLVYQPQIDLASGCMQGVEALLRWHHPERGAISPATFIPIAEEAGLIVPIGDWVLRSACKQAARWAASGLPRLTVAVNVSARQFGEPGWVDSVKRVLDETGLDPSCLELELTESLVMHDVEQAVNVMQRLRALKVRFAIDDFGTGYSSLALLKRLPIEQLKIDRTFVRDIADDDDDKAIVSAVISIGHRLNMTVVAEGVETVEQVEFLRANGCDSIQGYHVGRPMPAGDIEAMLLPSRSAVARNDAADAAATEDATDADAAQEMAHTMAQEMAQEMAAAC